VLLERRLVLLGDAPIDALAQELREAAIGARRVLAPALVLASREPHLERNVAGAWHDRDGTAC
jgi:hypothetical protein